MVLRDKAIPPAVFRRLKDTSNYRKNQANILPFKIDAVAIEFNIVNANAYLAAAMFTQTYFITGTGILSPGACSLRRVARPFRVCPNGREDAPPNTPICEDAKWACHPSGCIIMGGDRPGCIFVGATHRVAPAAVSSIRFEIPVKEKPGYKPPVGMDAGIPKC